MRSFGCRRVRLETRGWGRPLRPAVPALSRPPACPTCAQAAAADEDYYKILGVPRGASLKEMKSAFRSAAKKLHPDVNASPTAAADFKRLLRAYETLSDPKARAAYEQRRARGPSSPSSSRRSPSYSSSSSSYDFGYNYNPPPPGSFDTFWEDFLRGPDTEEIDDDFGRILKDLFAQIESKGAGSILEDFVSYLEKGLNLDEEGQKREAERRRQEEEERRRRRAAAPPPPPRPRGPDLDDELAELKRKMGKS